MELYDLSIHETRELLDSKEVSYKELAQTYLNRIDKVEDKVGALLKVMGDKALSKAEELDQNSGQASLLTGIPCGLKDNICTQDIETTCASKMLSNFIPPYNATVVEKLEEEGSIILAKTNMDEFAMGSSTESSFFKKGHNPWDLDKVPGGSSGGSAASVAAGEVAFALGTDTGGSIRQPACFCGVVGLKPTYGLVSRYGAIAFASSLDQVGPITKDVRDSALVLNAIAGHDPRDTTSAKVAPKDYTSFLTGDIKGLRIGVPKEYFQEGLNEEVEHAVKEAITFYKSMGAEIVDTSLPYTEYALSAYYIISSAEASSNMARYDGIHFGYQAEKFDNLLDLYKKSRSQGFGDEVKRRIMLGTYALSSGYYDAYYKKALQVRTLIKEDFDKVFKSCDIILSPTCPGTAFGLGERIEDPLAMYLLDIYTVPVNIAGLPAISIPCGFDKNNMPIGLQLIGRSFEEETVLNTAYAFEHGNGYHKKRAGL